jgi:hypothetical protein
MIFFKRKWKFLIGSVVCAASTAYIMTLCVLNSQNSIRRNGHWFNAQKFLAQPGYRSLDTEWARPTLVDNQLDLNAWHGFQMLCTTEQAIPQKVTFRMQRDPQAYVDFIFNYGNRQGAGIRLGPGQAFYFEFDFPGSFLKKKWIPFALDFSSRDAQIQIEQVGNSLFLEMDGQKVLIPEASFEGGSIGFRGSNRPLAITEVEIQYKNGKRFFDDFHRTEGKGSFFVKNFVLFFLLNLIVGAILSWTERTLSWSFTSWRAGRGVLVFAILWYVFDFFYIWPMPFPNYVLSRDVPQSLAQSAERSRQFFFFWWDRLLGGTDKKSDDWYGSVRPPVFCESDSETCINHAEKIPAKKPGEIRLVLVGGSFFQGGGADTLEHTFYVQLLKNLRKELGRSKKISLLNLSAAREGDILAYPDIDSSILASSPDMILFEMRSDIYDKALLARSLEKLASFKKPSFCFTRFIPKTNALTERQLAEAFQRSPCIRYEDSVLLANLEKMAEGFVHVDSIHITGFAQKKFADWMTPKILQGFHGRQ